MCLDVLECKKSNLKFGAAMNKEKYLSWAPKTYLHSLFILYEFHEDKFL